MSPAEASLHAGHGRPPVVIEPPPQLYLCLRGVACSRADTFRPRTLESARRAVSDLATSEPDVQEMLAVECLRWANHNAG